MRAPIYQAWLITAAILFTSIGLAGCPSIDRKPQTVEEGLYIAAEYGVALVRSTNDAYRQQAISKTVQLQILDRLQGAHDAISEGLAFYEVGAYSQATSKLDMAQGILRSVAAMLPKVGEQV